MPATVTWRVRINATRWIEYWYDSKLRLWTALLKDAGDNQIGEAVYHAKRDQCLVNATATFLGDC